MSPLALRSRLRGARARAGVVLCVVVLGGAIAVHHTGIPADHGMGIDAAAMVVCLAVVGGALATVAALPVVVRRRRALDLPRLPSNEIVRSRALAHLARAGPSLFVRLAVLRR